MSDEELNGLNLDEISPEEATPEQVEQLLKATRTSLAQKGHWKEKYNRDAVDPETKKLWKELSKAPEKPESHSPKTTPVTEPNDIDELRKRLGTVELSEEKRKLQHRLKLSPEETDLLVQMSGGDPAKAEETLKTDFFQAGLKGLRSKNQVEDGTPSPSSRLPKVEGKDPRDMSPEELQKNWGKITGAEK